MYMSVRVRPRLSRADQRAQTRARLLEAAAEIFIERGFMAASVESIAERAGYTRGAFYSNFRTREELFAELLQERVYSQYREMATASSKRRPSLRETGRQLAAIQADPRGRWLFRLWLELLAHAGRDEQFRQIAAAFWSSTRERGATSIVAAYEAAQKPVPTEPQQLATAMIALDIGLALQHFVDPDAVPLDLYPDLYELLFARLQPRTRDT